MSRIEPSFLTRRNRDLRHIARCRIDLVQRRAQFKNKVHAILAKYEFDYDHDLFSKKGMHWLKSIDFLSWSDKIAIDSYVAILETMEKELESFTKKIASISLHDESVKAPDDDSGHRLRHRPYSNRRNS